MLKGYKYRQKITVDSSNIDQNLTYFPLSIILNSGIGHENIFQEVGSDYQQLNVTKEDGVTKLYVEVETWNYENNNAFLKVSSADLVLSSGIDTSLYIYYGILNNYTYEEVPCDLSYIKASGATTPNDWSTALEFSSTGSKFYTSGAYEDSIYQFDLTTNWDVSTATRVKSKGLSEDNNIQSIRFNPDVSKMYMIGTEGSYKLHQYSLSTPGEIDTISYEKSLDSPLFDDESCFHINVSGTKLYKFNNSTLLEQYSIADPWNIGSTISLEKTLNLKEDPGGTDYSDIRFSYDGYYLFLLDSSYCIRVFQLYYPWEIDVALELPTINFSDETQPTASFKFYVHPELQYMYVHGGNTHSPTYQYEVLNIKRTDYLGPVGYRPEVWANNFSIYYTLAQNPSISRRCIIDSTGNGVHGTSHGMVSEDLVTGDFGKALHFDGNDNYISLNEIPSGDFSIIMSFNRQGDNSSKYSAFVARNESADGFEGLALNGNDTINYDFNTGGGGIGSSIVTTLNEGEWYRLGFKREGASFYAFKNGVRIFEGAVDIEDFYLEVIGYRPVYGDRLNFYMGDFLLSSDSLSDAWFKTDALAKSNNLLFFDEREKLGNSFKGIVKVHGANASDLEVHLRYYSTHKLIDSCYTTSSGTFSLISPYSGVHYLISFPPSGSSYNAQILYGFDTTASG